MDTHNKKDAIKNNCKMRSSLLSSIYGAKMTFFNCTYQSLQTTDTRGLLMVRNKSHMIVKSASNPNSNCRILKELKQEYHDRYHSFDEMVARLASLNIKYPTLTRLFGIGESWENRTLVGFQISTPNPNRSPKKALWYLGLLISRFNSGLHAREWIGPYAMLYTIEAILYALTDNTNTELPRLLSKFDLYFTPLSNPDGYEYSRTHNREWRKNRRQNGDGTVCVDLNRNFPVQWGSIGTSNDTSTDIYCGPSAASEPETRALVAFAAKLNLNGTASGLYAGIDFHSYGQQVLRSWGYKAEPSSNELVLKELGDNMAAVMSLNLPSPFVSLLSGELYPSASYTEYEPKYLHFTYNDIKDPKRDPLGNIEDFNAVYQPILVRNYCKIKYQFNYPGGDYAMAMVTEDQHYLVATHVWSSRKNNFYYFAELKLTGELHRDLVNLQEHFYKHKSWRKQEIRNLEFVWDYKECPQKLIFVILRFEWTTFRYLVASKEVPLDQKVYYTHTRGVDGRDGTK